MKKTAFLFPGQGSQTVGMGLDFFQNFEEARRVFEEADEILKRPLSKIIFEGPMEVLTETRNSQAAIFVTSLAILAVIQSQYPHLEPAFCAGLSLGEYTALVASKKASFKECLPLVEIRGEYMNEDCLKNPGTMAALFGLSSDEVKKMVAELHLPKDLWVANFNCPGQTVISGTIKGVEVGSKEALARGAKRVIPLKVFGAFHSGLMENAREKLKSKLEKLMLNTSGPKLVMNVSGKGSSDEREIRENLMQQVTSSVRWEESIKEMSDSDLFLEIGCGRVLAGLNKQMNLNGQTLSINKVSDLENLSGLI